MSNYISSTIVLFICAITLSAAPKLTRQQYIAKYSAIAVDEMNRYGIPASITLAQGCLESGNGNSLLASKSNNHFGIKCHDWNGAKTYHDDDRKNECFRVYKHAKQSFEDHSQFLVNRSRYADLFKLKMSDYKGWAKGLKKAGYATDPKYPTKLINIIEEYELYKFDNAKRYAKNKKRDKTVATEQTRRHAPTSSYKNFEVSISDGHKVLDINRINYIIVRKGDTFSSINAEFELRDWELFKYNDIKEGSTLIPGQIIYIQSKRSKAARHHKTHKVAVGETMHQISQKYGIKLKSLYKKNHMVMGSEPRSGQIISLRKKI